MYPHGHPLGGPSCRPPLEVHMSLYVQKDRYREVSALPETYGTGGSAG